MRTMLKIMLNMIHIVIFIFHLAICFTASFMSVISKKLAVILVSYCFLSQTLGRIMGECFVINAKQMMCYLMIALVLFGFPHITMFLSGKIENSYSRLKHAITD